MTCLLWLQNIREALGPGVEAFFVALTNFAGSSSSAILLFIIYWCVDRETGCQLGGTYALSLFVNQLIKNTACIYRPWIRDPRIEPSAGAKPGATGYSFPSGHTVVAVSLYGQFGWKYRAKKWLMWLCFIFVLLVAFSRVYLGYHTLQDVLTAFIETILVIIAWQKFLPWLKKHPEADGKLLVSALLLCVLGLIYWVLKPYPMDYVNGVLLVDPEEMQVDCFQSAGLLSGFAAGCFVERRYIRFSTDNIPIRTRILRGVIGAVCVSVIDRLTKLVSGGVDPRVLM
ncbi:MAG: phosphatase PAP2 family protein, partial [Lachnospiraceae bacterium]|nr:phosphatase PAP2 family protein [Lachnospiraceae bacterium]